MHTNNSLTQNRTHAGGNGKPHTDGQSLRLWEIVQSWWRHDLSDEARVHIAVLYSCGECGDTELVNAGLDQLRRRIRRTLANRKAPKQTLEEVLANLDQYVQDYIREAKVVFLVTEKSLAGSPDNLFEFSAHAWSPEELTSRN